MTIAEIQGLIRKDKTRTLELKKTTGELKEAMPPEEKLLRRCPA